MSKHVVIIGAGQAASSCAGKLRKLDGDIGITLIGEETSMPYQRPPLSKGYAKGEVTAETLLLRSDDWYKENNVDCRTGIRAEKVDPAAKTVSLSGGETISYDTLVFATGSRPRPLPASAGGNLEGVHLLRGLGDADRLKGEFSSASKVLIVGGGYIGLEAAAVFRGLGLDVCLVEAAPRILSRVASEATSGYFRNLHKGHGVDVLEGTSLVTLNGDANGRVIGATLSDGRDMPADFVLIGIGGLANDQIAADSGLACENGIVVDARGRTSDPSIFACGDCALLPFGAIKLRLESVQNAIDQAEAVAAEIVGEGADYAPVPWFWSDQYDVKLQIAGLSQGHDSTVMREGKRPGSCSIWYYQGECLIAVDAMNDGQAYMVGRKLLSAGINPSAKAIGDPDVNLTDIMKAGQAA